jgi:hypothetical protein
MLKRRNSTEELARQLKICPFGTYTVHGRTIPVWGEIGKPVKQCWSKNDRQIESIRLLFSLCE